jgi:hypothetical protein
MGVRDRSVLVLGGHGLVGLAVCRELLRRRPGRLVVSARGRAHAVAAVEELSREAEAGTRLRPAWGDVFFPAEWQLRDAVEREAALAEPSRRRRLIAELLEPLDEAILEGSTLARQILGQTPGLDGRPAEIVVDCINTATAVAYQDLYGEAQRLAARLRSGAEASEAAERLLASLALPQLVRHVQVLYEAMRRAGTRAYIKVGTSGTGGMGLNIPYTHGEERPSRLLLAKAAVAGAQTLLTFLMARTPGQPAIVKEVKPTALIGWRDIGHGPIRHRGRPIELVDVAVDEALPLAEPATLAPMAAIGTPSGEVLRGVYIDTGENGRFTADELAAITAAGQMELVTAEEIARVVVAELEGRNTGRDVIAGLDATVLGPSYRAAWLREAALTRLRQLEATHGPAVAFEILGPPRLSKLLFEAELLRRGSGSIEGVLAADPQALAARALDLVTSDRELRRHIVSIGLAILLPDGERLLRGPRLSAMTAEQGWVDLRPASLARWRERLRRIAAESDAACADASSRHDRAYAAARQWRAAGPSFDVGEVVGRLLSVEDAGTREKD